MKVGGLFAGYGGLELAVSRIYPDAEPVWFSEVATAPSRILAHHWPDVPNLGDITRIDWLAVQPIDIMTGGSPCPDLSTAGKRLGMVPGSRSNLWESMREGIAVLRPKLVIWENVRGALSARAASEVEREPGRLGNGRRRPALRALGRVLGDLASLGYDATWVGLRAADVGAPHGRWRVFVVAWPSEDPAALTWPSEDPAALLPTPAVNDMGAAYTPDEWDEWTARMKAEHANGNGHGASLHIEALRMLPTPRVSDANGAGSHGDGGDDLRTVVSLLPTPTTRDIKGRNQRDDDTCLTGALLPTPRATDGTKGGPNQRGSSGDLMLPSAVQLLPTPMAGDAKGARNSTANRRRTPPTGIHAGDTLSDITHADRWGVYGPAIRRWEALTRPAPDPTERDWERWEKAKRRRLTSTLPVGMRGSIRFIVSGPPARLSPRFVEWMQGIPDGWVVDVPGVTRNHALTALGNGVVPQQAAEGIAWCLEQARKEAVA